MSNVTVLPGVCPPEGHGEVDEELVKVLEELLEEARTGVLQGLAWASVHRDHSVYCNWRASCSTANLGWAIHRLDHQYVALQVRDEK